MPLSPARPVTGCATRPWWSPPYGQVPCPPTTAGTHHQLLPPPRPTGRCLMAQGDSDGARRPGSHTALHHSDMRNRCATRSDSVPRRGTAAHFRGTRGSWRAIPNLPASPVRRSGGARRAAPQSPARETDAPGPARWPLCRSRDHGHVRADPLPGVVRCAWPADADHCQAAAREPADDESQCRSGQRGLCGGHGAGGSVCPAPAAAQDAGHLRGVACHRIGADGSRAEFGDVHRRPRDPGPLHQPAADRRRSAPGNRLPASQAPRHGRDHEHVHLRGGRARPVHRWRAGGGGCLATAILDRRRDLGRGARAGRADL
jgi:hypothetical protein